MKCTLKASKLNVCVQHVVSGVEVRAAATNEGHEYESDVTSVNRASANDDITLCENTLYAQSPQPQQAVPCAYVPLREDSHFVQQGRPPLKPVK